MKTTLTIPTLLDLFGSNKKSRLLAAAMFLVMLGTATMASAGPLWLMKLENAGHYIQVGIHGQINVNHNDPRTPMPAQFWTTPVNFGEVDFSGGDSLQITGSSQHLVPICPGEVPKGGVFNYGMSFNNLPAGVTQRVVPGATLHPGGTPLHHDMFISAAVANCINPGQIQSYGYISIGRHDPPGCAAANSVMKPEEPTPDEPFAVSSLIYEAADSEISLGVAVPGISPDNVTGFYLGDKTTMQPILNLHPLISWHNAEDQQPGLVGTAGLADVVIEPGVADEILAGNTYLAIETNVVPGGLLLGDLDVVLVPEPSTLTLLTIAAVGFLMHLRRKRR